MSSTTERSNINQIELSDHDIRFAAPAAFATTPMPGVSGRYSFLPTAEIISTMRSEGWKPVSARQAGIRLAGRNGYQRHEVRFQRRDAVAELDEFTPEVVLLNSHDRTCGYQLHAGLLRFVCRNGMMVADAAIPAVHVRHTGRELTEIVEASSKILGQLPVLADRVASFRSRQLDEKTAGEFARQALTLRYSDPNRAPIRADQLLQIRRYEDASTDLWSITNRVQENLLRGGMRDTSRVNRAGKPFRAMRPIRGLDANVEINLGVWRLAEDFRQN